MEREEAARAAAGDAAGDATGRAATARAVARDATLCSWQRSVHAEWVEAGATGVFETEGCRKSVIGCRNLIGCPVLYSSLASNRIARLTPCD